MESNVKYNGGQCGAGCNCVEIAEIKNGGPVKSCQCLKPDNGVMALTSEPIHPVKSLQEIISDIKEDKSDPIFPAYVFENDYAGGSDCYIREDLVIKMAELYASQFKTPPVQEDQILADLGAWMNQEMDITETQENVFRESRNRDMVARCDSSIRTYQKVIRMIAELKYKYTIIPKQ